MPISREFGPRYDTPEKQEAEMLRRQHIRDALLSLPPEVEDARRTKMRQQLIGRSKSEEQVQAQSRTWNLVKPLRLRDGVVAEIAEITGFTRDQIRSAIYNKKRTDGNRISQDTDPRKEENRRSRSHMGKKWGVPVVPQDSEEQRKRNSLAKAFLQAGLVSDNLDSWNKLISMYENGGRQLPESLADKLIVEIFFKAMIAARDGNHELIEKYEQLGNSIDPEWFKNKLVEEKQFINRNSGDCRHHWVLGDPKEGVVLGDCKHCGGHKAFIEDEYNVFNSAIKNRRG